MDYKIDEPTSTKKDLGELLVEEKLITPEQLEKAYAIQASQGGSLGEILLKQGLVKPEDLAMVQSILLNIPFIDLKRHSVQPRALRLIPEEMARKHTLIPLDIIDDALVVVMADPQDVRTIADIRAQAKMRIEAALGIRADIERAIDLNYRSASTIEKQVNQAAPAPITLRTREAERLMANTPVAEMLNTILTQAIKDRASDIHIEPQEDRLRIRVRIDGILHDMYSLPTSIHDQLVSRIKILADMDIAEQRRPQDGQFSFTLDNKQVDIRVSTLDTPNGERVSLRILDKSLALFTLAELGFQGDVLKKFQGALNNPIGMILVSGPTGSGKTTTLYAAINELDRNERNIMTIEDPIEYRFIDINQTQVNPKAGITFATGLRAIMRHDPDVILVGEIRDCETVATAIQSALTGHLVLSSIHANDAVGVLFRLIDLNVDPAAISSTLIGIVAQRMVRRICSYCRTPYRPSSEEQEELYAELKEKVATLYHGAGCNFCAGTGYRGRTGIFEFLILSEAIRELLRHHTCASEIKAMAIKEGMMTMRHDGMLKVKQGITTVAEVIRNVFTIS